MFVNVISFLMFSCNNVRFNPSLMINLKSEGDDKIYRLGFLAVVFKTRQPLIDLVLLISNESQVCYS